MTHLSNLRLEIGIQDAFFYVISSCYFTFFLTFPSTSIISIRRMASLVWCCQSSLNLCKYQVAESSSWDTVFNFKHWFGFSVQFQFDLVPVYVSGNNWCCASGFSMNKFSRMISTAAVLRSSQNKNILLLHLGDCFIHYLLHYFYSLDSYLNCLSL